MSEVADRKARLRTFASKYGLIFAEGCADPPDERFFLSSLNTGDILGIADNPMCGVWQGLPLQEMDYRVPLSAVGVPFSFSRTYRPLNAFLSAVLVHARTNWPYLCIRRKDWVTRVADALDRFDHLHHDQLEILTGSPDFDRTFELRGRDADFAHALIDPSMAEALLRDCQGFAIEMAGDAFVVYGPFVEPSELGSLFNAAVSFHDHIPARVWSKFGRG